MFISRNHEFENIVLMDVKKNSFHGEPKLNVLNAIHRDA